MKTLACFCICAVVAGCFTPHEHGQAYSVDIQGREGRLKGFEGGTVALCIDDKGKVFVGSTQPMMSAIDDTGIRQIVVPKRVGDVVIEGIERYGLAFSETLEEVSIEDGVKIGPAAFYYDVKLKTARLPVDLSEIPSSLFSNCVELEEVKIPGGVGRIGDSAFYGTALSAVYVPDSVTYIGHGAFGRCRNLSRVSLPAKVVVEEDAFADCNESILKVVPRAVGAVN